MHPRKNRFPNEITHSSLDDKQDNSYARCCNKTLRRPSQQPAVIETCLIRSMRECKNAHNIAQKFIIKCSTVECKEYIYEYFGKYERAENDYVLHKINMKRSKYLQIFLIEMKEANTVVMCRTKPLVTLKPMK